jgi:hypothetical protein
MPTGSSLWVAGLIGCSVAAAVIVHGRRESATAPAVPARPAVQVAQATRASAAEPPVVETVPFGPAVAVTQDSQPRLVSAATSTAPSSAPASLLSYTPPRPKANPFSTDRAPTVRSNAIGAPSSAGGLVAHAKKPDPQAPEARAALSLVGEDEAAEALWQLAINDPTLSPDERKDLIEDLNEDGFPDPKHITPDDLPLILSRLALIEQVAPEALDETNAAAFAEAYKDLVEMLDRLSQQE